MSESIAIASNKPKEVLYTSDSEGYFLTNDHGEKPKSDLVKLSKGSPALTPNADFLEIILRQRILSQGETSELVFNAYRGLDAMRNNLVSAQPPLQSAPRCSRSIHTSISLFFIIGPLFRAICILSFVPEPQTCGNMRLYYRPRKDRGSAHFFPKTFSLLLFLLIFFYPFSNLSTEIEYSVNPGTLCSRKKSVSVDGDG